MFVNKPDDFEEMISLILEAVDQLRFLDEEDVKHHLDHIELFLEVLYDGNEVLSDPLGRKALCDVVDFQTKEKIHTN